MRLPKGFKGISMVTFYKLGSILFLISSIGSIINLKIQWASLNIGGKISMFGSVLLTLLFFSLFVTLYFQFKKQQQPQINVESPDIENFLKELKGGNSEDDKKISTTNGH